MSEHVVTFGQTLRNLRFGYNYSEEHGCWIRISEFGKHWLFDVQTPEFFASTKQKGYHRIWWGHDSEPFFHLTPLKNITRVRRPFKMLLDNDGRLVEIERTIEA